MQNLVIYQVTYPDGEIEYLTNPSIGFESCQIIKFTPYTKEYILPERNHNLNLFMSSKVNGFNAGWNACLDEFKRLNKE